MTATPVEMIYTTIVLVGVICNAWCLGEAVKDRRVVVSKQECSEMAWLIANGNVRCEVVRLLVQVSILGVGILALLLPPTVNPPFGPALESLQICVRLGFVLSTVLLAAHSLLNMRERRRILTLNGARRETRGGRR